MSKIDIDCKLLYIIIVPGPVEPGLAFLCRVLLSELKSCSGRTTHASLWVYRHPLFRLTA
jgi:hypothetical protein